MAGIRGMEWARYNHWTRFWRITVPNFINYIRINRWAKKNNVHEGQARFLGGDVWIDSDNKIYNRMGQCVGEIKFNEGFGVTR